MKTLSIISLVVFLSISVFANFQEGLYDCDVAFTNVETDIPDWVDKCIVKPYTGRKLIVVEDESYYDADLEQNVENYVVNIRAGEGALTNIQIITETDYGYTWKVKKNYNYDGSETLLEGTLSNCILR